MDESFSWKTATVQVYCPNLLSVLDLARMDLRYPQEAISISGFQPFLNVSWIH